MFEISESLGTGVVGTEWIVDEANGKRTTLGIRPAPQLLDLRQGQSISERDNFQGMHTTNYEVEAVFSNLLGEEKFAFNIRESPDGLEVTEIIFDIKGGHITLDKSQSSLLSLGTNAADTGTLGASIFYMVRICE